jgi:hypothetical protein
MTWVLAWSGSLAWILPWVRSTLLKKNVFIQKQRRNRVKFSKATKAMTSTQPHKIPDYIFKNLLQDLEGEGQPSRDEINLLNICNKSGVYGEKGSDIRRAVQRKFAKLKEKTLDQYVTILDVNFVQHGATTARLLRESAAATERLLRAEDTSIEADKDLEADLAIDFSCLSMETERKMASPPRPSTPPPDSATRSSLMFSPPRFGSPFMDRTREGTAASSRTVASSMAGGSMMKSDALDSIVGSGLEPIGDGTRAHPYIVVVDLAHPERNREFGIERVSNISHNSYTRNAFHIRLPVAVPDYDQWEASIPTHYSDLKNRVVEVKGPSRSFWMRDTEKYHKKMKCSATKQTHAATELEIDGDEFRQVAYWLLVFPDHVTLDNQIFSEDSINVEPGYSAMSVEANETEINKKLFGMAVYWRIAEIGGRRVEVGKPKPNARKLFD